MKIFSPACHREPSIDVDARQIVGAGKECRSADDLRRHVLEGLPGVDAAVMRLAVKDSNGRNGQNVKPGLAGPDYALRIEFPDERIVVVIPDRSTIWQLVQKTGPGIYEEGTSVCCSQARAALRHEFYSYVAGGIDHRHKLVNGQLIAGEGGGQDAGTGLDCGVLKNVQRFCNVRTD